MVKAKLIVWIRDSKCKPYRVRTDPPADYVYINHCNGDNYLIEKIPLHQDHVEIEVAPGCYVVYASLCEPQGNDWTDKVLVTVGCNQDVCVNLIAPNVYTCAIRDANAIIREARVAGVPDRDIRIATRTILAAGRVSEEDMIKEMEARINLIKDEPEAKEILQEYKKTIEIVRDASVVKLSK